MLKRGFAWLLAIGMVLTPRTATANENIEELKLDEDLPAAVEVVALSGDSIPAKSAILMSDQSGQVLHEQNADEQLPPASVTKVMTILLTLEALDSGRISMEDMVTCSVNAASMGGSQIWLEPEEQMSVQDLFKAVVVASANDASVALGEHIAGTEEVFVEMMNKRAQELGMVNTTFKNCTGLDAEGHLTTARDIALMTCEVMKHPIVTEYSTIWMDSLRNGESELVNTNRLIRFYPGATGLKTGTTSGAGSCLSATATRDGLSLVAVVMGCDTSDNRFASARGLLDYGFANFLSVEPPPIDDQLTPVQVIHGVQDQVTLTYDAPGSFVVEKQKADSITQEVSMVPDVQAPVEMGQVLGKVQVIVDGVVVKEYNLKAVESVPKMNFGTALSRLAICLFQMKDPRRNDIPSTDSLGQSDTGESATEPCECGIDTCYCKEIGDICGCSKK